MEFFGIKFKNQPNSNMCYSNACVNRLMASQGLMSIVDPNHDGGNPCRICWHFSHFKQVGHLLPNEVHSTEALKTEIALHARQFSSNCQQDPVEYIAQISRQCTILQEFSI